jgi:copper oxidase (laccase) domain-containing protein
VGEDVLSAFRQNYSDLSVAAEIAPGRYKLDLAEANRRLLLAAGIRPQNIAVAGLCTACSPESFFSYRREGNDGQDGGFYLKGERNRSEPVLKESVRTTKRRQKYLVALVL